MSDRDSSEAIEVKPAQFVLRYPIGRTAVEFDNDGEPTKYRDNYELACDMLGHLLQGGSIALPQPIETAEGKKTKAWELVEMSPFAGFDWDWTEGHHNTETGKRWKITDATGKEFQNVRKLNSNTGFIEQTGPSDGPIYVRTLAPLPITVEQVDIE